MTTRATDVDFTDTSTNKILYNTRIFLEAKLEAFVKEGTQNNVTTVAAMAEIANTVLNLSKAGH